MAGEDVCGRLGTTLEVNVGDDSQARSGDGCLAKCKAQAAEEKAPHFRGKSL